MPDLWAEWIMRRRFGDDEMKRRQLDELGRTRDRLLGIAQLKPAETVLDVGCGDGLIGFSALARGASHVTFSDVSSDLLEEAGRLADEVGVRDRASFLVAPAEDLSEVDDASVDLVTTRSVLIFVEDKAKAFGEFLRVLRPGGRIALFEPINRLNRFRRAYDIAGIEDLDARVQAVFDRLQPTDTDPMLNFDERDLLRWTEDTGFSDIKLTLEIESGAPPPQAWSAWAEVAWNPKVPTLSEAITEVLKPDEAKRYVSALRSAVEEGRGSRRMARAWLTARRPE
jgi:arsenite methyltransferase